MKKNKLKRRTTETISFILLVCAMIFVSCLLLSNILAAKIICIFSWSVSAGVLVFPISFIINDLMAEVYGLKITKAIIIIGFVMELLMVALFELAIALPSPEWFENTEAFSLVVGNTPRTAIASLLAYLLGSLTNAYVMQIMKEKNNNKFELRAIVSTVFGELVDSMVFVPIAFLFLIPFKQAVSMIFVQVVLKTLYEVLLLPITKKIAVYICAIEQFG